MATAPTNMTMKQAAAAFGVTLNTLHGWIRGTPTKAPLPVKRKGRTVLIPIAAGSKWADKHNVPIVRDITKDVLVDPVLAPVKPGPRAGYKVSVEV